MTLSRVILGLMCVALIAMTRAGQDSGRQDFLPSAPSATRGKPAVPPAATTPPRSGSSQTTTPAQPAKADTPAKRTLGAGPGLGAPPDSDIETTIHRTVNEVPVVFTVTYRHGHNVKDMQRADFQILDNNQSPAEVRSFHRETNLPPATGLLVDASNSVRDRFKFEQDSAIEFLNETVGSRYDQALWQDLMHPGG